MNDTCPKWDFPLGRKFQYFKILVPNYPRIFTRFLVDFFCFKYALYTKKGINLEMLTLFVAISKKHDLFLTKLFL